MGSYKGVISRITIVIRHIRGRITPVITTHEPPSVLLGRSSVVLSPDSSLDGTLTIQYRGLNN